MCMGVGVLLGGMIMWVVDPLLGTFIQDQGTISKVHLAAESVFPIGGLIFGMFLVFRVVNKREVGPNDCVTCGYNLTGNVSGRCPECGTVTGAPT